MIDHPHSEISLPRGDQKPHQPIDKKSVKEAHRTLSILIVPNGSWHDKLRFLKGKAKKYAQILLTAKLTTTEVSIAYRTMFFLSLTYSLGVTWMTKKQCE